MSGVESPKVTQILFLNINRPIGSGTNIKGSRACQLVPDLPGLSSYGPNLTSKFELV